MTSCVEVQSLRESRSQFEADESNKVTLCPTSVNVLERRHSKSKSNVCIKTSYEEIWKFVLKTHARRAKIRASLPLFLRNVISRQTSRDIFPRIYFSRRGQCCYLTPSFVADSLRLFHVSFLSQDNYCIDLVLMIIWGRVRICPGVLQKWNDLNCSCFGNCWNMRARMFSSSLYWEPAGLICVRLSRRAGSPIISVFIESLPISSITCQTNHVFYF